MIFPHVLREKSDGAGAGESWMVPFWLVKRSSDVEESNCIMTHVLWDAVTTGGAGTKPLALKEPRVMQDEKMQVPVMTNHKELQAGQELVLQWRPQKMNKPSKRQRTWIDAANDSKKSRGPPVK